MLTNRQEYVKNRYLHYRPKHLILDGSVGSGKTNVLVKLFLMEIYESKNKGHTFIIGATTKATARRNFLTDMENIIGREIKLDIYNKFKLWGNTIYVFEGAKNDAWKKIRGMNSAGSLLGELTTLNRKFVKEVEARTRVGKQFIMSDTNPDIVGHWVNQEYILQAGKRLKSGRINIMHFNFVINDNTFLTEDYIESLKASYPVGTSLYSRNIDGKWTDETEASIYASYMKDLKYFSPIGKEITNLYVGIDLGIRDGTSLIFGTMESGKLKILWHYKNKGLPTAHYMNKIIEFCEFNNFFYKDVNIILPHDSVNRQDAITHIVSRFNEYAEVFPLTHRIQATNQLDMIQSTRKHLYDGMIEFADITEVRADLISKIKGYSWKVTNGIIDTTKAEHGIEWDAPSNIVDSLEYLVAYTLGMAKFGTKPEYNTIEYSENNNRVYSKKYK